jgi:hypothetical protein
MKIELKDHSCVVTREPGDPRFSGVVNAAGESRLFHHIKKALNAQGFDLIKKRMGKDGHLVDDMQQYLRTRKKSGDPKKDIYIWNGMWAIKGADQYLNEDGQVWLNLIADVFNPLKG